MAAGESGAHGCYRTVSDSEVYYNTVQNDVQCSKWSAWKECRKGEAVVGLWTQVEKEQGGHLKNDTVLN